MSLSRTTASTLLLAFLVAATTFACAAPTDDEQTDDTQEDLKSLSSAQDVGELVEDAEASRADAPTDSGYRAFSFDAAAGSEHVIYLAATAGLDPIAYVLDYKHRLVKRNDDRSSSTKDAFIRFKATTGGTYHVAFRTKERRPGTIMARLLSPTEAAETGTFADGWKVKRTYGTIIDPINVKVRGMGYATYYGSGCPADPFTDGTKQASLNQIDVRLQLSDKTVSIASQNASGSAQIAADGTFEIRSDDPRWGRVTAHGRVAAGGMVLLDDATTVACDTNSSDQRVYNATQITSAIGAQDTN